MSRLISLLSLLVFVPASLLLAETRVRVVPLFTISYPPPPIALADDGAIAVTDRFVFFGTDGGLFRAPLPLGSAEPERVAFEWTPITALAWSGGALYATLDLDHKTGPGGATHSIMKSTDEGVSWQPLDSQLEECHGSLCERLLASQIEVIGDRLFVNAGGNLLVSGDEGASWSILFGASSTGKPQEQACYDPAFAVAGQRLLMGGECPLDSAYLRTGTLRADRLGWQEEPADAQTPFLENRNVQFIRQRGQSNVMYAGIEGALLRSTDAGASYEFILHYDHDAPKYPYITHILFPSAQPSTIVIAGFDRPTAAPISRCPSTTARRGGTTPSCSPESAPRHGPWPPSPRRRPVRSSSLSRTTAPDRCTCPSWVSSKERGAGGPSVTELHRGGQAILPVLFRDDAMGVFTGCRHARISLCARPGQAGLPVLHQRCRSFHSLF